MYAPYPSNGALAGTLGAAALRGKVISDTLQSGQTLQKGQSLLSKNGSYELVIQNDGNFVLYNRDLGNQGAIWSTGTYKGGCTGQFATMGADGNLGVYDLHGACWASRTQGHPGARLIMQNDGNAVIYDTAGKALWASGTDGGYPPGEMDIFKFRDVAMALKAEIDKYTAAHPGATPQSDPKLADYVAKFQALARHAPHDAFGDALMSAGKAVVTAVTAPIKLIEKIPVVGDIVGIVDEAATAPLKLANDIASGVRLDKALVGALKEQLKIVHDVAPYVQTVISFVPGIGTGVSAAIGAGAALAEGRSIDEAIMAGVKGALPGGPVAAAAFDAAVKVAKGGNVIKSTLESARNLIPDGVARKAFDTGLAIATGANIQAALAQGLASLAPGAMEKLVGEGVKALQLPAFKNAISAIVNPIQQKGAQLAAGALAQTGINQKAIEALRSKLTGDTLTGFDALLKTQAPHLAWINSIVPGIPTVQQGMAELAKLAPDELKKLQQLSQTDLAALSKLTTDQAKALRDKAEATAAEELKKIAALPPAQQKQLADLKALSQLSPAQQKQLVDLQALSKLSPDQQKQLADMKKLSELTPQQQAELVAYAKAQQAKPATPAAPAVSKVVAAVPTKTTAAKPAVISPSPTTAVTTAKSAASPTRAPGLYPPYPPM